MQDARIWFRQDEGPLSLSVLKSVLESKIGCQVEDAEWRLGDYVVPQLRITSPLTVLLQIEADPDYVPEEAVEFSNIFADQLSRDDQARLALCNARIAIGDSPPAVSLGEDGSINAWVGWTSFDPGEEVTNAVLRQLAIHLDGFLHDNVNGTIWSARRPA